MHPRTVEAYMTPAPHTIGAEQDLATARSRMRQLGIRHLPVLHGGSLVGIVSERDLVLVDKVDNAKSEDITVEDVMTPEPYVADRNTPLSLVTSDMAKRKVGCAIVTEGSSVIGILTTTDAMALFSDHLNLYVENGAASPEAPAATRKLKVPQRVLDEHAALRQLFRVTGQLADRVTAGEETAEAAFFERTRELYRALIRHLEIEDVVLLPALRQLGPSGTEVADELRIEHSNQREQLRKALQATEAGQAKDLASVVQRLIEQAAQDMREVGSRVLSVLEP